MDNGRDAGHKKGFHSGNAQYNIAGQWYIRLRRSQSDQSETETDFLVAYAERFPFIMGVVGWIDLRARPPGGKIGPLQPTAHH